MSTGVDLAVLRDRLLAPNGPYPAVDLVPSTGSTNADLLAAAAGGAPDGSVLLAGEQHAGRGRRSRTWASPAGCGIYLSVLLRPTEVSIARLGSVAMVAGVALVRAVRAVAAVESVLKWPNDLLAGPGRGKCAGVLSEAADGGAVVVVGIGLNVDRPTQPVTPGPGGLPATSLAEAGAPAVDHTELATALLTEFAELAGGWRRARGDLAAGGVLAAYRDRCATIGQRVRIELPDGSALTGVARDIDGDGELVLADPAGGTRTVSAGDVVHLRGDG